MRPFASLIVTMISSAIAAFPLCYGLNIPYGHAFLVAVGIGMVVSTELVIKDKENFPPGL